MLLTRSPLTQVRASSHSNPFDLHVLGTPPAFVLSQDQTLREDISEPFVAQSIAYWHFQVPFYRDLGIQLFRLSIAFASLCCSVAPVLTYLTVRSAPHFLRA